MTPKETLEVLGKAKFDGRRKEEENGAQFEARKQKEKAARYDLLTDKRADFITLEQVETAIKGYKPGKENGKEGRAQR